MTDTNIGLPNRAMRRRAKRAAGQHRAIGKRGSRPEVRTPNQDPHLEALAASGFVVATPRIAGPDGKPIA